MNGPEIRQWRKTRGLSREELARLCSVSYAAVANWELGRNQPHGAALQKLQSLMSGEISVTPLTPQEERLLDELVGRGGFGSREEFLLNALLQQIRATEALPEPPAASGGPGPDPAPSPSPQAPSPSGKKDPRPKDTAKPGPRDSPGTPPAAPAKKSPTKARPQKKK